MRYIFCLGLLFSLTFCAAPGPTLNKNVQVNSLAIFVKYDLAVPRPVQTNIDYHINRFINDYNLSSKRIQLSRTLNSSDSSSLTIHVLGSRLVSSGQQAAGVIVSVIGFALPFILISAESDFIFTFWYFPKVLSAAELSLSPDINGSEQKPVPSVIKSPGFLKNYERQIDKHGPAFARYLSVVMKNLEKSMK